jgi:hypothetical protein
MSSSSELLKALLNQLMMLALTKRVLIEELTIKISSTLAME